MSDLNAMCAGLAAQLTAHTGLRAHGKAPGSIAVPAAVVIPSRPAILYGATMDGETTVNLLVIVAVTAANDVAGQDQLLKYVASSGTLSVPAAVQADPTLGGTAEDAVVRQVASYGLIEYAGQQYMGATFLVEVYAHL